MLGFHPTIWYYRYFCIPLESIKMWLLPQAFKELYKKAKILQFLPEAKQLYDLAKKNAGRGAIVEIGSALGGSACFLSRASQQANGNKVYCVDLWPILTDEAAAKRTALWPSNNVLFTAGPLFDKFLANVRENGVPDLIVPIRGKSTDVAQTWKQPIQLLFIDCGHDYEDIKADIRAWEPFVVKGGVIVFHDYGCQTYPGVAQAVDELITHSPRFSKLRRVHSLAWATKTAEA